MSEEKEDVWAKWRENQAPFQPLIFKSYLPQWPLWKPWKAGGSVLCQPAADGIGRGDTWAGRRPAVKTFFQKVCTPSDWNKINVLVSMHKSKAMQDRQLAEAFMAQLLKAYQAAYMKYDLDFISGSGADYRYRYQFLALKFREFTKIPANTPYDKRPKA